jgi:hypothetical protein
MILRVKAVRAGAEAPAPVDWWGLWGRHLVPGRECGGPGQEALTGRRRFRHWIALTSVKHPYLDWPATSVLLRRFAFTR